MNLKQLRNAIPFKWRVQSLVPKANPQFAIMIPYVDARDVQDKFDEVCGAENWQNEHFEVAGKTHCRIGIKIQKGQSYEWVWKSDRGSISNVEKDKGESSDAFKRAAVYWGVNRSAYQMNPVKLPVKEYQKNYYPIDKTGGFLKGQNLYDYCNKLAKVDELEVYFDVEEVTKDIAGMLCSCESVDDVQVLWGTLTLTEQEKYLKLFKTFSKEIDL